MTDRKLGVIFRDLILPTLAILLTAYNVISIRHERKDSYNDILYTQQMAATSEIAENLSLYQSEIVRLLRIEPQASSQELKQQTSRVLQAGRAFSKAYTKWAPIMPDGLLLEVTRYHAVATRTQEPFIRETFPSKRIDPPQQLEKELMRSYAKLFHRMRAELGVDTLNDESKLLLEKLQTGRVLPAS